MQSAVPIHAFIVMESSGTPLFARRYGTHLDGFDSAKTALLAGFLSAIDMFSQVNLKNELHDIGFGNERFFFSHATENIVIVISAPDPYLKRMERERQVIERILSKSRIAINLISETSKKLDIGITEIISEFGMTLDSIILESSYLETDSPNIDNYFEQTKKVSMHSQKFEDYEFENAIKTVEAYFKLEKV